MSPFVPAEVAGTHPAQIAIRAAVLEWSPLVVFVAVAMVLGPFVPSWAFMWLLALALFAGFKWATLRRFQRMQPCLLTQSVAMAYLFGWPGMDPRPFAHRGATMSPRPTPVGVACVKTAVGLLLLFVAARAIALHSVFAAVWIGMIGTVLVLHFGTFHLLAIFWRSRGVPVQPLMSRPMSACSIDDFWTRRWNRAFAELASPMLFRPVSRRFGAIVGIVATFAISGLLHDVVISIPAGGGYGRPTLYFLIQSVGVLVDRAWFHRASPGGRASARRLFGVTILVAPVFLLFHEPFVMDVFVPFMRAIRAI